MQCNAPFSETCFRKTEGFILLDYNGDSIILEIFPDPLGQLSFLEECKKACMEAENVRGSVCNSFNFYTLKHGEPYACALSNAKKGDKGTEFKSADVNDYSINTCSKCNKVSKS